MTAIPLPTVAPESCDGCGVCCMEIRVPPFCVLWEGEQPQPIDDTPESLEEVRYALAVPADLRRALSKQSIFAVLEEKSACTWFDMATRKCRHYDYRPPICREFQRGEPLCLEQREEARRSGQIP
jgi:uncharacterized protein